MIIEQETDFAVCPFTVIVDSREQAPYSFTGFLSDAKYGRRPLIVKTRVQGLATADYSIEGFEDQVAVERKSKEDLYGTIGAGRDRFERELERLASFRVAHVVIEATWPDILSNPPARTKLLPKTVFRSINAWEQRYPTIHWHAMGGRILAEHKTFRVLERFYKEQGSESTNPNDGADVRRKSHQRAGSRRNA